jgi:hypothetical protein
MTTLDASQSKRFSTQEVETSLCQLALLLLKLLQLEAAAEAAAQQKLLQVEAEAAVKLSVEM